MTGAWNFSEWIRLGDEDLRCAEYLLGMKPVPVEVICHHCAQALEKHLKAFLVKNDVDPVPRIHDLDDLCKRCAVFDPVFEDLLGQCAFLNPFSTQVRYPSDMELTENDALRAIRAANTAIDQIAPLLESPEEQMTPTMQ